MKTVKNIFLFVLLILICKANANNLRITTVSQLVGNRVRFTLRWDNSWNNGTQRDAVWIFIKFRKPVIPECAPSTFVEYTHARLSTSQPNIPVALNYQVDGVPNNTGIMLWSSTISSSCFNVGPVVWHITGYIGNTGRSRNKSIRN